MAAGRLNGPPFSYKTGLPAALAATAAVVATAPAAITKTATTASTAAEPTAATSPATHARTAAGTGTATTTLLARTSLVDCQGSTFDILSVQGANRRVGRGVVHFHKAEAPEPPGLPISDHGDGVDLTELFKHLTDFIFSCPEGQIADVQPLQLS
jgi:hypothetical protein